tara:strand:- start:3825 stop:4091 length:267 start_codon:yes stop_codon:yes gene_type:complete
LKSSENILNKKKVIMGKLILLANLKKEHVLEIKKLEKKLNTCLVAFTENETPEFSNLTVEEIEEIKKLEKSLGISLLAYELESKKDAA